MLFIFLQVFSGHQEVVQLLLEQGANVMFQDGSGKTALHLAAACGHVPCCDTLLMHCKPSQRELLLSSQDNQSCTPLHWACYNG